MVDGQHSTLWANNGPVLIVDSASVTLKNLRIEVTVTQEMDRPVPSLRTNYKDTKA